MEKFFISFLVLLTSASFPGEAKERDQGFKARGNYYAAASLEDLNEFARYEASGNRAAIQRMVKQKRLISLKANEELNVQQAVPNAGNLVQVQNKDNQSYWTTKDALVGGDKILATEKGKTIRNWIR